MRLSSTLTKVHIIDAMAERNGFTRKKSIETVEILLELMVDWILETAPVREPARVLRVS